MLKFTFNQISLALILTFLLSFSAATVLWLVSAMLMAKLPNSGILPFWKILFVIVAVFAIIRCISIVHTMHCKIIDYSKKWNTSYKNVEMAFIEFEMTESRQYVRGIRKSYEDFTSDDFSRWFGDQQK